MVYTFKSLLIIKKKLNDLNEIESPIRCSMPYFRLSIKADGNVRPCCVGYGEKILVGNIYKQTISDIWNSKLFKDFQSMHKNYESSKNPACKECLEHSDIF